MSSIFCLDIKGVKMLTQHIVLYTVFVYICKSNRSVLYRKSFCHTPQLSNFEKLAQIQTFILPDFSHHLSKIVIIRFLCFSLLRNKLDYEQITT